MNPIRRTRLGLALLMGAGLLLSACGVRGTLERPEPLWGSPEEIQDRPGEARETPDPEGPVTPRPN